MVFNDFDGQNARYFAEEMISYILDKEGYEWHPDKSDRLELLQSGNLLPFETEIGDGVILICSKFLKSVITQSDKIWLDVEKVDPDIRGKTFYSRLLKFWCTMPLSPIEELVNIFIFMAVVGNLCIRCTCTEQPNLIPNAAEALERALHTVIETGFAELLEEIHLFARDIL